MCTMRPARRWRAALALMLAGATACARTRAPAVETQAAGARATLQRVLDSVYAEAKFPGVTVGVAFADGSSLGLAAGWSDTARRIRMTPAHRLLQGSVGKTYVAAVALQLVREGRLDLDAKISRYLDGEPWLRRLPNADAITVRQLMNHTSGLVRYEFKEEFTRELTARPGRVWRPEALLAYLFDTKAAFPAGAGWDYSDTNYIVLGIIIERLTGRRYYEEMRTRLLVPLDLRNTVPSDRRDIPGLSQGYAGADNPFGGVDAMVGADGRFAINPQFEWTGGGVASTSEDLARWASALYGGRVLDSARVAEMLRGVPAPLGPPGTTYGLGVIVRPTALGLAYGHGGFFPGYSTEVMYFPADRLAVAVQLNTSAAGAVQPTPARVIGALVRALRATTSSG